MMLEMVMKEFYKTFDNSFEIKKDKSITYFSKLINYFYYLQLKHLSKKMDYSKYFERNKNICDGKLVIRGTRIQPITIMNFLKSNYYDKNIEQSLQDIKNNYPTLNEEQILISILYTIKNFKAKENHSI